MNETPTGGTLKEDNPVPQQFDALSYLLLMWLLNFFRKRLARYGLQITTFIWKPF